MTYCPDPSDPRVRRHMRSALGVALACFSSTPHGWSQKFIDKHIGRTNDNLGAWLRARLITCTDDYYRPVSGQKTGQVKSYVLNEEGVQEVKSALGYMEKKPAPDLGSTQPPVVTLYACMPQVPECVKKDTLFEKDITLTDISNPVLPYLHRKSRRDDDIDTLLITRWAEETFGDELKHLVFEYEDKSSRLWHPLQMMRRGHKKDLQAQAGLTWHYDIECCAPTLILQHAQSLPEPMDLYLETYEDYLRNRQVHRFDLAKKMECDVFFVKTSINALFCGARVGAGESFALGRLLRHYIRVKRFKEDPFIEQLRKDIKVVWSYIEPSLGARYSTDKNGHMRKVPLSPKRKWGLYFDLERSVLDVVRAYLAETNNPHFLEHDGWVTRDRVDVDALATRIYEKTGFKVRLDEEHHNHRG